MSPDVMSQLDTIDERLKNAQDLNGKDEKYLKNHPDITGMMSKGNGGQPDKDEEEMMDDIGMSDELGESSKGKGSSNKKDSAASGDDPTDSIDKELEDKSDGPDDDFLN